MSLTCTCDEYYDAPWYYEAVPDDFSICKRSRGVRCCSCKTMVRPGDVCLIFDRSREPNTDIEARIYGEGGPTVPLAPDYHCAICGEKWLNLNAYGYCVDPRDDMEELMQEHRELHGIKIEEVAK